MWDKIKIKIKIKILKKWLSWINWCVREKFFSHIFRHLCVLGRLLLFFLYFRQGQAVLKNQNTYHNSGSYLTKQTQFTNNNFREYTHKFFVLLIKMNEKELKRSYQMNMNYNLFPKDYDPLIDTFSINKHIFIQNRHIFGQ